MGSGLGLAAGCVDLRCRAAATYYMARVTSPRGDPSDAGDDWGRVSELSSGRLKPDKAVRFGGVVDL